MQLECKVVNLHEIKNGEGKVTSTVVMAEVVMAHINKVRIKNCSPTMIQFSNTFNNRMYMMRAQAQSRLKSFARWGG